MRVFSLSSNPIPPSPQAKKRTLPPPRKCEKTQCFGPGFPFKASKALSFSKFVLWKLVKTRVFIWPNFGNKQKHIVLASGDDRATPHDRATPQQHSHRKRVGGMKPKAVKLERG